MRKGDLHPDEGLPSSAGPAVCGDVHDPESRQIKELRRAILRAHPDHARGDASAQQEFARLVQEYKRLTAGRSTRTPAPRRTGRPTRRRARWRWRVGWVISGTAVVAALVAAWSQSPPKPLQTTFVTVQRHSPSAIGSATVALPAGSLVRDRMVGPYPDIPLDFQPRPPLPKDDLFSAPWLTAPLDDAPVPFRELVNQLMARKTGLYVWPLPLPIEADEAWGLPKVREQKRYPAGPEFERVAERASRRFVPASNYAHGASPER